MESEELRSQLRGMLGIPAERCALAPEFRGRLERDGFTVEKWIWTSEPGSRVPSVLYRPADLSGPAPAMVTTCGHGGSKSQWQYTYVPQVYARMGLICLVLDPIGEEERHLRGELGTRAHDPQEVHERADAAGRLMMGKLVFDTIRGIDFLLSRDDVDAQRIGVGGNSLGGAKASWMGVVRRQWGGAGEALRHGTAPAGGHAAGSGAEFDFQEGTGLLALRGDRRSAVHAGGVAGENREGMRESRKLILVKHSLPQVDPGKPAKEWMLGEEGKRRSRMSDYPSQRHVLFCLDSVL